MSTFDGITYIKGQAFIRMLEDYLGEDVFRAGIRQYVEAHAYSNATTADLWQALAAALGPAGRRIAGAYTEQGGVPLIVAEESCAAGRRRISLRQDRFVIHDPDARPERWQVPVAYGPPGADHPAGVTLLDGAADVDAGPCGEALKLNLGGIGYYRVQYDAATQAALVGAIKQIGAGPMGQSARRHLGPGGVRPPRATGVLQSCRRARSGDSRVIGTK